MKVYLAGPMRGYPEYNFPAFRIAAKELRDRGHQVWSPAERDESEGFNPKTDVAHSLKHYMSFDLPAVLSCDAVAVLPGWEKSVGAKLEVHVAHNCDMRVFTMESLLNEDPTCALTGERLLAD